MTKKRVYELAKELNTTSKRLMEKLSEVNVVVKNHMSLLEENELNRLYDHIGIIRHDEEDKGLGNEDKKIAPIIKQNEELKRETKKETKNAPRIIRKTEINLDSVSDMNQSNEKKADSFKNQRRDGKGANNRRKNEYVKVAPATSGLRPGFVRETKPEFKKVDNMEKEVKAVNKELEKVILEPKAEEVVKTEKGIGNSDILKDERKNEAIKTKYDENNTIAIDETIKTKSSDVSSQDLTNQNKQSSEIKLEQKINENQETSKGNEEIKKFVTDNEKPQEKKQGFNNNSYDNRQNSSGQNINNRQTSSRPNTNNRQTYSGQNANNRQTYSGPNTNNRQTSSGQNTNNRQTSSGPNSNNRQNYSGPNTNNRQNYSGPNANNRQTSPGQNANNRQTSPGQNANNNKRPDHKNKDFVKRDSSGSQGGKFGNRPMGDKDKRTPNKPLEIPKPELTPLQKEELNNQRGERRSFKDTTKEVKRDTNRPLKGFNTGKNKNKPVKNAFSDKKEVSEVLSEDYILEEFYDDGVKKVRRVSKGKKEEKNKKHIPPRAVLTSVTLPEVMTVKELAESLKKAATEVIKKLIGLGIMATLNQEIDFDTASVIADEYGIKTEKEIVVNEEDILFDDSEEENEEDLLPRPPVVVVMGHVDHGKTSLLDAIKETNVIDSEAGGITQHIGAYMVKVNDRNITFLDTPGHEAFTAMRARGAQVTDVAILVVAADDGVMPQTVEAINHAKAANVTIIVAINKMDKPGANPDRVKQELTEHGLVSEEWGGETICVEVSAKNKTNIDHLLEMVLLAADMLELKANPNKQAKGTVIEAKLDKDRGPIATMLVQRGTLNQGDSIVTGMLVGRIRAMVDDKGHKIINAGPSTPVEILGLPEVPEAGEIFYAITDEKIAKQLAEKRKLKQREQHLNSTARVSLDDLFNQIKSGNVKELNIIVKADVQGSVEAVKQSLGKLTNDEVRVRIVHGGVGAITESDVTLALVSNAIIIGFNVRPAGNVADIAKESGVDLRLYRIIYNAIEDIEAAMKGMLDPTFKEVVLGHVEIRQIFKVSGIGTIGGGYVIDGKVVRNADIRLVRDDIVVHEGKLASLKRFKDDVKEVAQGYECGFSLERYNDIKEGDIVEAFTMEEVKK
ncbi:UNVERIFIED_CONTAM: translation initiation factor IF-2 [Acetivibrio alkalicellulosi]